MPTPMKGHSPDPVVEVTRSGSAEEATGPVRSLPPAFTDGLEMQVEDASAEAPRLVPPEVPAMVKLVGEPAGNEAPGVVPPEMSDEILDWLVNDDVLEERLLKEIRDSMKRVHNHHVVMFL